MDDEQISLGKANHPLIKYFERNVKVLLEEIVCGCNAEDDMPVPVKRTLIFKTQKFKNAFKCDHYLIH